MNIKFYEKPGCITGAKQKKLLTNAGVNFSSINLLTEQWTQEKLKPFLGTKPVAHWFNPTAPDVKSGLIDPKDLSESQAIQLLVNDPILIRRPLFESDDKYWQGFDWKVICENLNLQYDENIAPESIECCSHSGKKTECP